jgi:hypothetical protein
MKFFNIDCHISVIADIKNIFEDLGHTVESWCLSNHRWVFNLPECKSPVINSSNWKNLDEKMAEDFYANHKDELDKYDAFICTHHVHFLKFFERFNKPIIVIASTRYEYPFINDPARLSWLEDSLRNNKNIIKVANNQFDQKYCENFLGNKWEWIPSLCDYTGAKYNPTLDQSVLFSKFDIKRDKTIIHQNELGRYTWEHLYSYTSIVHLPYNVSTMSIFEQCQAGVPLNFPSLDFALSLISSGVNLFSEIIFPNNLPDRQPANFLNKKWLSYSDFYNRTIKANLFDSDLNFSNQVTPKSNKEIVLEKWKKQLSLL